VSQPLSTRLVIIKQEASAHCEQAGCQRVCMLKQFRVERYTKGDCAFQCSAGNALTLTHVRNMLTNAETYGRIERNFWVKLSKYRVPRSSFAWDKGKQHARTYRQALAHTRMRTRWTAELKSWHRKSWLRRERVNLDDVSAKLVEYGQLFEFYYDVSAKLAKYGQLFELY
jgi:hypothetical protein